MLFSFTLVYCIFSLKPIFLINKIFYEITKINHNGIFHLLIKQRERIINIAYISDDIPNETICNNFPHLSYLLY